MLPLADQQALIEAHLTAAQQCAKKFVRRGSGPLRYDDFLSAAYQGLVKAARTYDPDHDAGASFATYAYRVMDMAVLALLRQWKRQHGWVREGGTMIRRVRLTSLSKWGPEDGSGPTQAYTADIPDPTLPFPAIQRALDGPKVMALCATPQERRIVLGRLQGLTFREIGALPGVQVSKQRVYQVWTQFQRRAAAALTLPIGGDATTHT